MGLVPETKVRIFQRLAEEPSYGYRLAEDLDLSHGYIYTHLKELADEGMIRVSDEIEGKKVFELTQNSEYLLKALTE